MRQLVGWFLLVLLAGCAAPKATVLRYESGMVAQHNADSPEEAEKVTIKAAREYCEKRGGEVVVLSKEAWYKGTMNETLNKGLSKASGLIPLVGILAEDAPYSAKIAFRCD